MKPKSPASPTAGLPPGSRVVSASTTTVAAPPATHTPRVVSTALPNLLPPGPMLPPIMPAAAPLPGRKHNPTFDAPPPDQQLATSMAGSLRGILGNGVARLDELLHQVDPILKWVEENPLAKTVFTAMGINLDEVSTFVRRVEALLDEVKPKEEPPAPEAPPAE